MIAVVLVNPIAAFALAFPLFSDSGGRLLRPVTVHFSLGTKVLEVLVNLGEFPERRNQQHCDHKQQELKNHFFPSGPENSKLRQFRFPRGTRSDKCSSAARFFVSDSINTNPAILTTTFLNCYDFRTRWKGIDRKVKNTRLAEPLRTRNYQAAYR
jgi:hypothetical protein